MELNYIVKLRRGAIKQSIDTIMELNNSVDFWKFIADERKKNVKRLGELVLEGTNDITTLQNINATFKKEISSLIENRDYYKEANKQTTITMHKLNEKNINQEKEIEELRCALVYRNDRIIHLNNEVEKLKEKEDEVMKKKATKKGGGKPC
jgi:chromosome segregation ATPase